MPRDRLRREVRAAAAAAAASERDFLDNLRNAGVLVKLRTSTINPGEITGYAVGLPGHHTATGTTVWYGGGRLAPDLTLRKLRHRWQPKDAPPPRPQQHGHDRAEAFHQAARVATQAADELKRLIRTDPPAASAVAAAAADLLTSTARATEGRRGGQLTNAAEAFDRAAREPYSRPSPPHRRADQLRAMSRLIAATGRLTGDRDTAAALRLVLQLSAFAEHLANLRESQHRLHQARDARIAGRQLRTEARPALAGQPSLLPLDLTDQRLQRPPQPSRIP